MYRKIISVVVMLTFMIGLIGCATVEQHPGAATGTGIGAVAGATTGALLGARGAKTETAVLGGLLGALAGGLIGHYAFDQKKTAEQTAQKYNYQASRGAMVRVESVSTMPATVKRGSTVDLKMTYALLGIGTDARVTETREIRHNGELYGKPEVKVRRSDGTFTSIIPLTMPSDAPMGKYEVIMSVQTADAGDSKGVSFNVE